MTDSWRLTDTVGGQTDRAKLKTGTARKLQVLTDTFTGPPTAVVKLTMSADRGAVTDGHLVLQEKLQVLTDGFTGVPVAAVRLTVSADRGTLTDGQLVLPRLQTVLTDGWTGRWLEGLVYMGVLSACLTDWRPVTDGLMVSHNSHNSHKTFPFAVAIDNLVFNSRDCFAIDHSSSCHINSCFSAKCLAWANNAALFKDSLTRVDETVLLWELVCELLCFDDRDRCVRLLGWEACEILSSGFNKLSAWASRYTQTRSCNCWRAVNLETRHQIQQCVTNCQQRSHGIVPLFPQYFPHTDSISMTADEHSQNSLPENVLNMDVFDWQFYSPTHEPAYIFHGVVPPDIQDPFLSFVMGDEMTW